MSEQAPLKHEENKQSATPPLAKGGADQPAKADKKALEFKASKRAFDKAFFVETCIKPLRAMTLNRALIGVGAGATSAVLFLLTTQETLLSLMLATLSPLPLIMATLGWTYPAGLIALFSSFLTLCFCASPVLALSYLIMPGLPAFVMAALCLVRRTQGRAVVVKQGMDGTGVFAPRLASKEEAVTLYACLSPGFLLLCLAGIGFACALGFILSLKLMYGHYDSGVRTLADALAPAISDVLPGSVHMPDGLTVPDLVLYLVHAIPMAVAVWSVLLLGANLWLGARCVHISGLLPRPMPKLSQSLRLSPNCAPAMTLLCAACALPVPYSLFAACGASALGMAYGLQGLAMIHSFIDSGAAQSASLKALLFALLWLSLIALSLWLFVLLALLGFCDSWRALLGTHKRQDKNVRPDAAIPPAA